MSQYNKPLHSLQRISGDSKSGKIQNLKKIREVNSLIFNYLIVFQLSLNQNKLLIQHGENRLQKLFIISFHLIEHSIIVKRLMKKHKCHCPSNATNMQKTVANSKQ